MSPQLCTITQWNISIIYMLKEVCMYNLMSVLDEFDNKNSSDKISNNMKEIVPQSFFTALEASNTLDY